MKKLFVGFGILVLSIFLFMGTSFAYTYDSAFDPSEFGYWTPTSQPTLCEPGVAMIPLQNNTDRNTDFDAAVVYLARSPQGTMILAYQYHCKSTGETKFFELHPVTGHYEEVDGFSNGTFEQRIIEKMNQR